MAMMKLVSAGGALGGFAFSWLLIGDLSSPEGRVYPSHLWGPAPTFPYWVELSLGIFGATALLVALWIAWKLQRGVNGDRRYVVFIPIFAAVGFFAALYARCVTAAHVDLNFSMVAGKWLSATAIALLIISAIIYDVVVSKQTRRA